MIQVLGMHHKLHVRKILVSREKLKPLTQQEERYKESVLLEVRLIGNAMQCDAVQFGL